MPTPFQQHVSVSLFQRQTAGLFAESVQHFSLVGRDGSRAVLGQQASIQALASGGQLALRDSP